MFAEILMGIGLILFAVLAGVFVLPIRIGAAGFYRDASYQVSGFARGLCGLCGVVCEFDETGLQWRVVLGPCTVWRPKAKSRASPLTSESDEGDSPVDVSAEPERDGPTPKVESAAKSPDEAWHKRAQQYLGYAADARPILMRFVKRLLRVIKFQHAAMDVEVGLGDPAYTGRLFGYVEAVKRVLGKRIRISLTPNFLQPHFAGEGSLRLSIYLYRLLWAALALAVRGGCLAAKIWWAKRKVNPLTADH